jgi:predicted transcriptional regulator
VAEASEEATATGAERCRAERGSLMACAPVLVTPLRWRSVRNADRGVVRLHLGFEVERLPPGWPSLRFDVAHIDAYKTDGYDASMRTTVEIDPDVDARLRALARERGVPLRVVLNDALRAGLRPGEPGQALALAGQLEDEEILRKLELRK